MRWGYRPLGAPRMSDISERIARLSPEKRGLLALKLSAVTRSANRQKAIPKRADAGPLPLSFEQQRLWFLEKMYPGGAINNIGAGVRLAGELDVRALERSLSTLIDRHETLRTAFELIDGKPAQVIRQVGHVAMPMVDLSDLQIDAAWSQAVARATTEVQRPFDLEQVPLIRCGLFRLGLNDHLLFLIMHHIVCDGWSLTVCSRELIHLYNGYSRQSQPALPELPIQYADYAIWQRQWIASGALNGQLAYWKKVLNGAGAPLELPADYPHTGQAARRGAKLTVEIGVGLTRELRTLASVYQVTSFVVLLAAFAIVLAEHTGRQRYLIGTDVANRNRPETKGLIGFFVNQLVLAIDLGELARFSQLLRRLSTTVVGACDNQDIPFDRVVEALRPARRTGRAPLFNIKFVYQEITSPEPALGDMQMTGLALQPSVAELDLVVSFSLQRDEFVGDFEYAADVLAPETIRGMADGLLAVLKHVIDTEGQAVIQKLLATSGAIRREAASQRAGTQEDNIRRMRPLRRRASQPQGSDHDRQGTPNSDTSHHARKS